MRISTLAYLYMRRVRARPAQELLAAVGVALGVALMFAVQVADSSITDSSREIAQRLAGPATLQLRSRGPAGFDEALLGRVQRLPGVRRAVAVLDLPATIHGPHSGGVVVQLAGATPALAALDGLSRRIPARDAVAGGVMLPRATADALGISSAVAPATARPTGGQATAPAAHRGGGRRAVVTLEVRGRERRVEVAAILGTRAIGALAGATAAFTPLLLLQRLASLPGRVSRILVQSVPGRQAIVRGELERVAGGRLTVASTDEDVALLSQALHPNAQATGFFALVSGLVGLLLAFNAMLLTAPERRATVADLRIQGVRRSQLARMLLFQALCLGTLASLAGLLAGDALSRSVFHEAPNYLAAAFPLGSQTVIGLRPVLVSFAGGVLATCLAATPPLLDLHRGGAADAVHRERGEPGRALGGRARLWLLVAGLALIFVTSGLLGLSSSAAIVAIVGLALGAILVIPSGFTALVWASELAAARAARLNTLLVASRALRAATARSFALAATGAIAVFGSVAAEGAHNDLLGGLYRDYAHYVASADLWVANSNDHLATMDFPARGLTARIASLPGRRRRPLISGRLPRHRRSARLADRTIPGGDERDPWRPDR